MRLATMMRGFSHKALIRTIVVLAAASASAVTTSPSSDYLTDWVLDGDWAYGMARPEAAGPGDASAVNWSGDGSTLFVTRTERRTDDHLLHPKQEEMSILSAWSRKTGVTKELLRGPEISVGFEIWPLGTSSSVLVQVSDSTMVVDGQSGRKVPLAFPPDGYFFAGSNTSPTSSRFVIVYQFSGQTEGRPVRPNVLVTAAAPGVPPVPRQSSIVRLYDMAGNLVASAEVPKGFTGPGWSSNGLPLFWTRTSRANPQPMTMAELRPGQGFAPYTGQRIDGDLGFERTWLRTSLTEIPTGNEAVRIRSGWLDSADETSPQKHAIVAPEVDHAPLLSPAKDAIVYITRGVPMVRRMMKMPKAEFFKAIKGEKQNRAMSAAKQNALAIAMYGGDADDALPLNGNYADAINPYMRDPTLSKMFTYTYGGGTFPPGSNPAKIEIGFVQTDGGRAIAYGDGHVQWFPDNP